MLVTFNRSISINSVCAVKVTDTEDGNERTENVAYFSAQIDENGHLNINKNIQNEALYAANKAAVRADMAEFENKVYEIEDGGTQ